MCSIRRATEQPLLRPLSIVPRPCDGEGNHGISSPEGKLGASFSCHLGQANQEKKT